LFIRASLEAGGVEPPSTKEMTRMKLHANAPFGVVEAMLDSPGRRG
jgi:hypothetical protein